jgi:hypothetical protein
MTAEKATIGRDCIIGFDRISGDEERLCEDGAKEQH